MSPEMVPLNRSLDVDIRLWPQDVRGSCAWVRALERAGVLSAAEGETLIEGLDRVARRLTNRDHSGEHDEDIHSLVERLLHEEVGDVAGKLHTGRSRNDQVATDFRIWSMEVVDALRAGLRGVQGALLDWARDSLDIILPGYTHLQQGQPVRAAHWALSHFWPLERDGELLDAAGAHAAVLPLGLRCHRWMSVPHRSGAHPGGAGVRSRLREQHGRGELTATGRWSSPSPRLASAFICRVWPRISCCFGSKEFGFVRLSDGFSTGSSLMPQKRNPDVAELVRGKAGRLIGNLMSLLTVLKGLPTGYNRDLQEDKETLFDSVDTLAVVLPAVAGAVRTAEFQPDRIEAALDTQLLATDLADYLVRAGVPFRKAHEAVANVVRIAEERGVVVDGLELDDFRAAHPSFGSDVLDVFFLGSLRRGSQRPGRHGARRHPGSDRRGGREARRLTRERPHPLLGQAPKLRPPSLGSFPPPPRRAPVPP